MEVYVVEKSDDQKSMTLGFKNAGSKGITMLNGLIDILDKDPNVEMVRFIETHPELDDRKLFVKVRMGTAKNTIASAANDLALYFANGDIAGLHSTEKVVRKKTVDDLRAEGSDSGSNDLRAGGSDDGIDDLRIGGSDDDDNDLRAEGSDSGSNDLRAGGSDDGIDDLRIGGSDDDDNDLRAEGSD